MHFDGLLQLQPYDALISYLDCSYITLTPLYPPSPYYRLVDENECSEYFFQDLTEESDELWERHLKRIHPGHDMRENETWKDAFFRVEREKETHLRAVSSRIRQQDEGLLHSQRRVRHLWLLRGLCSVVSCCPFTRSVVFLSDAALRASRAFFGPAQTGCQWSSRLCKCCTSRSGTEQGPQTDIRNRYERSLELAWVLS